MKKFLLTMFAVAIVATTFAQVEVVERPSRMDQTMVAVGQSQKRSVASGLYFHKPLGSLYTSVSEYGYGYIRSFVIYPMHKDMTYVNMSTNPTSCRWFYNNEDYTNIYGDSEGNYVEEYYPVNGIGYYYPAPVLWNSNLTDSYAIPAYYSVSSPVGVAVYPELEWLGFLDDKSGAWQGSLLNGNCVGTGKFLDLGGTFGQVGLIYTSEGIVQNYPAPASPLYVEKIYLQGVSITGTPLKNNASLNLDIYDQATDKLLGTFTATASDTIYRYSAERGSVEVTVYNLIFTHIVDALFGPEVTPIIIEGATRFEIHGFDNDDIDFGPFLYKATECDAGDFPDDSMCAKATFVNEYGAAETPYIFYTDTDTGLPYIVNFSMYSLMDYVGVEDELEFPDGEVKEGCSVLRISDDGKTCHTYGMEDTAYDLGMVYVMVACPWYDDDKNPYYYSDDMPEWILNTYVDDSYNERYNFCYVWFGAEPLPEGVESRSASFHMKGRGYTDANVITVVQGYGDPAGIESVRSDESVAKNAVSTFTTDGRRVTAPEKGVNIVRYADGTTKKIIF